MGISASQIIIFGRSMGSGPATYLASKENPAALILFSPYTSIKEVAKEHVGWLHCLAPSMFNNGGLIPNIRVPTFIIHGKKDEVIKHKHGKHLYDTSGSPHHLKRFVEPNDMTHNTFNLQDDFLFPSQEFLRTAGVISGDRPVDVINPIDTNKILQFHDKSAANKLLEVGVQSCWSS